MTKKPLQSNLLSGNIADGYKGLVCDLGGEFIKIVEAIVDSIQVARRNEILGEKTSIKSRIKDYSSSLRNTEKKELDDFFGMEFVTATQQEKEFLILFFHLAFKIIKDKKMDKSNGYKAYHCTGDLKLQESDIFSRIDKIVQSSETDLYKDNPLNLIKDNKEGGMERTRTFESINFLLENEQENVKSTLEEMIKILSKKLKNIDFSKVPMIECHFMTAEVEQNAITGTACHSKYKAVDETLIKEMFNSGKLFRGINTPWKFTTLPDGRIQLQDIYHTLIETWPFLKEQIVMRRKRGLEKQDILNNECCDKLLATQFPFLKPFVENNELRNKDEKELWGALKQCMLVYSLGSDADHSKIKKLPPQIMYSLFESYGLIKDGEGIEY